MTGIIEGREDWRAVPGYEGLYEVSSEGRFRSLYFDPPRQLRLGRDSCGYPTIMLSKDGKRRPFTAHRLVCRAFHGEPFAIWNEAAHLDGDRTNPRADNLKWVNKVENHFHQRAHGTHLAGVKHPRAKLTEAQVLAIRAMTGARLRIAERFGISKHTVDDIRGRKIWRHLP